MVVGDRQVETIEHFSPLKKALQRLGSWVVRQASTTNVPDTTSGFRAYNREAALQMQVVSKFTYTLETIIQAGKLLVAVDHVPIRTNPKTRESRLFPSMGAYVRRNAVSIFRIYAQYEPLRVFWGGARRDRARRASPSGSASSSPTIEGEGAGHVQSLILGAVLFIAAMLLFALGVIGDLLAAQRIALASARSSACGGSSWRSGSRPRTTSPAPRDRPARPPARTPGRHERDREHRGIEPPTHDRSTADRSRPATRTTSTARPTPSCGA